MRGISGAIMLLLLCSGAASASGGISCTASDEAVSFSLRGGVSRGMGGALFALDASLRIRLRGVPDDLRRIRFAREHVAQYRLDGRMLELTLYRERPPRKPHGHVELDISSVPKGEEGDYAGTYALTVFEAAGNGRSVRRTGRIACMAE